MRRLAAGLVTGLCLLAAPALAQNEEIMVTGARRALAPPAYAEVPRPISTIGSAGVPVVTLSRVADNLVQSARIDSDTRDPVARSAEIYDMLAKAIALAEKRPGIVLSVNDGGRLVPLTRANAQQLRLSNGLRADTSQIYFVIKTALGAGGDVKAAQARIASFIKEVAPVGRAVMDANGEPDLSVVNPEQYRPAIIERIAADANMVLARMGAGYAVELSGLDRSVQWSRASTTEVNLFLPYSYRVVPKPN